MNRKVLLIAPAKLSMSRVNWGAPPLGIYRLAHWLKKSGTAEGVVWDPGIRGYPTKEDFIGYGFIGFSPLNETLAEDIRMMNLTREANPAAVLICGGVEATLNYQTILEKTDVEWIVTGYGEDALFGIVMGQGETIPGTIHRTFADRTENADLWDYYSTLDFSAMGYSDYWTQTEKLYDSPDLEAIRTVRLVTSTDCNRGCTFCSVTQWQRCAIGRITPPTMLTAEQLKMLVSRVIAEIPDVRTVYFCEDDFCQSRKRVEEFCEWSAGSSLHYLVQTHLSKVDMALIEILSRGRVRHLTMGIENASPKVLYSFNKPQKLDRLPDIIRGCVDAGIDPYLLIILFAPASTIEDLKINIRVLREWMELGAHVSIEPFTMAYRGSPLWESLHHFTYDVVEISPGLKLKRALRILPDDPEALVVADMFATEWSTYLANQSISHQFKGATGHYMVDLLEQILSREGYLK